jgi:hypothetical protein
VDGTIFHLFSGAFALLPLAFIGLAVALLVASNRQAKKRQAYTRAFAHSRGWVYHDQVNGLVHRWSGTPFGSGSGRRATEVLTGDFHGMQAISFRYQYTVSNGKSSSTYHFHVAALHLPVALPWLRLSPEGFGSSVSKFFGGQDIQFESQDFNDAWRVQASPPPQYVYDFIHPRMMERLMAPDARRQAISVEGADIYVFTTGQRRLETIDPQLNLLYGIVDLIPRHLWQKAGHDPAESVA